MVASNQVRVSRPATFGGDHRLGFVVAGGGSEWFEPGAGDKGHIAEQNQDAAAGFRLAGDCLESGTQRSEHPLLPVGVDDDLHAVKLRCQGRGDFIPPGSEDQDDLTDSGGLPDLVYEVAQDRFAGAPGQ